MRNRKITLILFVGFLLVGCKPIIEPGQSRFQTSEVAVNGSGSIGQTFVAKFDGLEAVELFFMSDPHSAGKLSLLLTPEPRSKDALAASEYLISDFQGEGIHRLDFKLQQHSNQNYYYLQLEAVDGGSIGLGSADGDAYLDGSMYQNDIPLDGQLFFRLVYDPIQAIKGLCAEIVNWLGIIFISILLYILPGLAILHGLWPKGENLSWLLRLTLAPGISIILYPILLLLTDLFDIHLGYFYAWLPVLFSMTYFLIYIWRRKSEIKSLSLQSPLKSDTFWPDITLLLLITIIFLIRFASIRSLDIPMWGDSLQHTMISQLIVDHRGLFSSWSPYADLRSFTYHFGFHANVAAFHWITGRSIIRSTLWIGQIFNILAVVSLIPLAARIGKNRWASVIAVLIAGTLSQVPMMYTDWGRYTQLSGQIILPVMIYLIWTAIETEKPSFSLMGMCWFVISGLALTHYRVLIFGILFIPIILVRYVRIHPLKDLLSRFAGIGLGSVLLFTPWLARIGGGGIVDQFIGRLQTPPSQLSSFLHEYNAIGNLATYMPLYIWALLLLNTVIGLLRRNSNLMVFASWWLFVIISANPSIIGLPGTGAISNYAVFIASYIPAGIVIGSIAEPLQSKMEWPLQSGALLAVVVIAIAGAMSRLNDINPAKYSLVTRPDIQASRWVQENTPEDSKFLVNSFFAYGGEVIVGSDAGWWLPLLSKRDVTLPPITYDFEIGEVPNYREEINKTWSVISQNGLNHPDSLLRLEENNVAHIFIGQRQGSVNYSGPKILDINLLVASPNYQTIYHQDRVWIFEIVFPSRIGPHKPE